MKLKFNNNQPTYIQIAQDLLKQISEKKYIKDQLIPSVRQLASTYTVTTNTIQNTLKYLEEKDVVYKIPAKGVFVKNNEDKINEIKAEQANKLTSDYIEKLKKLGLDKQEIKQIFNGEIDKND